MKGGLKRLRKASDGADVAGDAKIARAEAAAADLMDDDTAGGQGDAGPQTAAVSAATPASDEAAVPAVRVSGFESPARVGQLS